MSTNYDCKFFPNGRVVFLSNTDFDAAIKSNKEILIICNSLFGGYAYSFGATKMPESSQLKDFWEVYSREFINKEFTIDELAKFYKVIITGGEKIYMKTGEAATHYEQGDFYDWDTSFEDFKSIHHTDVTEEDFKKACKEVDIKLTIRFISSIDQEDLDSKCRALSTRHIGHWAGTKYETEHNR